MSLPNGAPGKLLEGPPGFDLHAEAARNPRLHAVLECHYRQISELFGARLAAARG